MREKRQKALGFGVKKEIKESILNVFEFITSYESKQARQHIYIQSK